MLSTLQRYVARELLKTFALTAVGLTLTFSLCGIVLNMIQAEVLTAIQVAEIMIYIMPISLTLTLPVSALFACAMVYGRLAADNEVDACRASGINIHRLLAPAVGLSIFTAAFTFLFLNYILPTFAGRLEALVRKDLDKVVAQSFKTRGYIRQGPYVLYCRDVEVAGREDGVQVLDLRRAAFMELPKGELKRCGTAARVQVEFKPPPPGGNPSVEATLAGLHCFDLVRKEFYEEAIQPIASIEIPSKLKQKPKWLTLPQLLQYRGDLASVPALRDGVAAIRNLIREASFYRYVVQTIQSQGMLRLSDGRVQYEIRAETATLDSKDMKPELTRVRLRQTVGEMRRDYTADRCVFRYKHNFAAIPDTCQIQLRENVKFVDRRDPRNTVEREKDDLDEVAVPSEILQQVARITDQQILDIPADSRSMNLQDLLKPEVQTMNLGSRIDDSRIGARKDVVRLAQVLTSEVNSRLAFSAGALMMLVLAAGLGIIFRGGQLLTAFVVSFVPGLFVTVVNIMGRQVAENTGLPGLMIIWSGVVLLGVADFVVLGKFLRR